VLPPICLKIKKNCMHIKLVDCRTDIAKVCAKHQQSSASTRFLREMFLNMSPTASPSMTPYGLTCVHMCCSEVHFGANWPTYIHHYLHITHINYRQKGSHGPHFAYMGSDGNTWSNTCSNKPSWAHMCSHTAQTTEEIPHFTRMRKW